MSMVDQITDFQTDSRRKLKIVGWVPVLTSYIGVSAEKVKVVDLVTNFRTDHRRTSIVDELMTAHDERRHVCQALSVLARWSFSVVEPPQQFPGLNCSFYRRGGISMGRKRRRSKVGHFGE